MFSTKHKVYTAESTAIDAAEDVSVEGKRYPTNKLGRAIVRHPWLMFITVILPVAFFVVGIVMITSKISYELTDFQLSNRVDAQASETLYETLTTDWSAQLTGESAFLASVDTRYSNTVWEDDLELRYEVDADAYRKWCPGIGFSSCSPTVQNDINLLSPMRLSHIQIIEQALRTRISNVADICYTNNLEYATVNNATPICVPYTSILQYYYPVFQPGDQLWHMTGQGQNFQQNVMPRMLQGTSINWFFDTEFSAGNRVTRKMRSLISLASSPREARSSYVRKRRDFVMEALNILQNGVTVPGGLNVYLGGSGVENARIETEASKEGYKVGVSFVIAFALAWWHCGAFTMGLYTAAQVIFVYMATCGLYGIIYGSLPLMTYSAIIWVTTFAMHGTLSFYDMFVYTSVMATKGRQNNLSVAQRMCFTMRRATAGVWIANTVAIIIFAVNTTSVFNSVHDFSVFMMIAFLWNMYFLLLPTPAFVAIHHFYFSNKRRSLQKQKDIINEATKNCRRDEGLVEVLSTVQQNLSTGEHLYTIDDDIMRQRIGANQGINKRRYKGVGNFLKQQSQIGLDQVRAARRDVTGAVHKLRKTKREVFGGGGGRDDFPLPANFAPAPAVADFEMDRFAAVGTNPFGRDDDDDDGPRYNNARLVPPSELIHIPLEFTERTEDGWQELCEATGQASTDGRLCPPKTVSLQYISTTNTEEMDTFAKRWETIARRLDVPVSEGRTRPAVPLAVRAIVRAQDPSYTVGGRLTEETTTATTGAAAEGGEHEAPPGSGTPIVEADMDGAEAAEATRTTTSGEVPDSRRARKARIVDPGVSGIGLKKLRYRWQHRSSDDRGGCCGLCGHKRNETPEQRMERLMHRRVKQEGYTLFERFLIRGYVPAVHLLRFLLTAVLIALAVAVVVASVLTIKAGGIPVTLVDNDKGQAAGFAALDDAYGQRGTCTFCGPYYSLNSLRGYPTDEVTATCLEQFPKYGRQMNAVVDDCGVCFGEDACLDCAGTVDGTRVLTACGGCEEPASSTCTCDVTRDCTYCQWALNKEAAVGGFECSVPCCSASSAVGANKCDQYTGLCGVTSDTTSTCNDRGTWLTAGQSPTGEAMCACRGHWRGPSCEFCDCENGGMCTESTGECVCPGTFTGPRCQTCAASCVAHGTCPSPPPLNTWDIRTCVPNQCSADDIDNGVFCAACNVSTLPVNIRCMQLSTSAECRTASTCFWRESDASCVFAKPSPAVVDLNCTCTNTQVWDGASCGNCKAPQGGTCISATLAKGCNGVTNRNPLELPSTDRCGRCGGDGFCPGCDGVVGSGLEYDHCGVCGGNNECENSTSTTTATAPTFLTINYIFDFRKVDAPTITSVDFAIAVRKSCQATLVSDTMGGNGKCIIDDYLTARSVSAILSLGDLYLFARQESRVAELGFDLALYSVIPSKLNFMYFRFLTNIRSDTDPAHMFNVYQNVQSIVLSTGKQELAEFGATMTASSKIFQNAAAGALSLQSLWFAVGIGLAVCFTFMFTYYVSLITAVAACFVAIIVCFGSLTVCGIFSNDWTVDAVLQVCISCTIPIGIEYIIHFTNGYFDYLQTTTSHLFARDVTRRTAVQGAALRSLPSVCTCVVCVIICSIMFDVSHLVPSKRSGQISITMHLLVLIAVFCYSGALAALGPMKTFQHWTLSAFVCFLCGIVTVIVVLILFGIGGVMSPTGQKLLTHN